MHRLQVLAGHVDGARAAASSLPFDVAPEVAAALAVGGPVVALESTIVSHGMPFPENLATARAVEADVRAAGAVPATIAVLGGVVKIGLQPHELEQLARAGHEAAKCSRRDLAWVIATRRTGSTTVAATALLAARAGIRVFVTGGIGGVHRGAQTTMDISADLPELGKTPIAVVCAGVKSLLDVGATLEVLETQGVTVIAMGQDEFPAFYSRKSSHKAPLRLDSVAEVAAVVRANAALALHSGILVGVPIPANEEAEAARTEIAIQTALREADSKHISGRDITPFLLARVADLTGGESLRSNVALIRNNATVGARIAVELSRTAVQQQQEQQQQQQKRLRNPHHVEVVGGLAEDVSFASHGRFVVGESNPGTVTRGAGGVGHNVAVCLARLARAAVARSPSSAAAVKVSLVSAVGQDHVGAQLLAHVRNEDIDTSHCTTVAGAATATYGALVDASTGALVGAVAAMSVFDNGFPACHTASPAPAVTLLDCNIPASTLSQWAAQRHSEGAQVWVEPVSMAKCTRCVDAIVAGHVYGISPNEAELRALAHRLGHVAVTASVPQLCQQLLERGVRMVVAKCGAQGVYVAAADNAKVHHFPAPSVARVVSVTGAGDCLLAGLLFGLAQGLSVDDSMRSHALRAVQCCLAATDAVPSVEALGKSC